MSPFEKFVAAWLLLGIAVTAGLLVCAHFEKAIRDERRRNGEHDPY